MCGGGRARGDARRPSAAAARQRPCQWRWPQRAAARAGRGAARRASSALGRDAAQCGLPLRLGQKIQALPRPHLSRRPAFLGRSGTAEMRIGRLAAVGALFVLIGVALPLSAQNFSTDIPLPSGGSERVLFAAPAAPYAILIMFPGATGIVEISASGTTTNRNFLVRTLPLWVAEGFAVEVLASPNGASLLGQRHTPGYLVAIDRAVDFARSRANAPIWLVGTSQGSTAAANGAAHLGGKIAGLVLTSSVTRPNRSGETVFDSEPGLIPQPALIVANQGDTCRATPPGDAPSVAAALARSPRKEVVFVASDQIQSDPCEALSPHGFLGIEPAVVHRISDWIRAAPVR